MISSLDTDGGNGCGKVNSAAIQHLIGSCVHSSTANTVTGW